MDTAVQPPPVTNVPGHLAEKYPQDMQARLTDLSLFLRERFEYETRNRTDIEERWLRDLRQYKGLYEPNEWKKLNEDKSRSRVFYRITRKKVRAYDTRMMDMLFPGGKAKNWSIRATPEPDTALTPLAVNLLQEKQQEVLVGIAQQLATEQQQPVEQVLAVLQQQGMPVEVPEEDMRMIRREAAEAACGRMESTIADQLAEVRYKHLCRQVIHSGHVYGTGIMKSPLARMHLRPRWVYAPEQGGWQMQTREVLMPFLEFVPVWSFYPDSAGRSVGECEYFFQRHVLKKDQVAALAERPGFDAELIGKYLTEFPDGDASPRTWESLLDHEQSETTGENRERTHKRYEVLEYWGLLNDIQLRSMGFDPGPVQPGLDVHLGAGRLCGADGHQPDRGHGPCVPHLPL